MNGRQAPFASRHAPGTWHLALRTPAERPEPGPAKKQVRSSHQPDHLTSATPMRVQTPAKPRHRTQPKREGL